MKHLNTHYESEFNDHLDIFNFICQKNQRKENPFFCLLSHF